MPNSESCSAACVATGLRRRACSRNDAIAPRFNRKTLERKPRATRRAAAWSHRRPRIQRGPGGDSWSRTIPVVVGRLHAAVGTVAAARRSPTREGRCSRPARAALRPPSSRLSRSGTRRVQPVDDAGRKRGVEQRRPQGWLPLPLSMAGRVSPPRSTRCGRAVHGRARRRQP